MHESKWVRFVYAFALAWIAMTWLATVREMTGALLYPHGRTIPPLLMATSLLTAAFIVPLALQRLVVVLRAPGPRRMVPQTPMARAVRFLGLGVLNVCAIAGLVMLAGVVLAVAARGGGVIVLGLSYLKPFASVTTPLTGVLLYETSRLLAYESACARVPAGPA